MSKLHPDLSAFYGLAFHPQFDKNRYVYACYVRRNDVPDGSIVSRFTASRTDPPVIDPKSEQVILTFWSGGHNGGCLVFGKDGYLYLSTGDGAAPSPPDPKMTGQDCSDLLSSILRLDVDHPEPGKAYSIPADNPFTNLAGVRPEIWAFGFRNPWKMSFDRATGDLWVGDVGWELWELIDKVERGGNFGWSVVEGPQPVNVEARRGPTPILPTTKAHPHSEAASITGGYVYRGTTLPGLSGAYIYGDYQTGIIWALRARAEPSPGTVSWRGRRFISWPSVKPTTASCCWSTMTGLTRSTGWSLLRPVRLGPFPAPPERMRTFCLGAYRTACSRCLAVRHQLQALVRRGDRRTTPGSARNRQDQLERPGDLAVSRRLCAGADDLARGRAGQAGKPPPDRNPGPPLSKPGHGGHTPTSGTTSRMTPNWSVPMEPLARSRTPGQAASSKRPTGLPARSECVLCHNPWVEKKTTVFGIQSASPLGLNTAQLNKPSAHSEFNGNQLTFLHAAGILSWTPDLSKLPSLVDPYDESADLDRRARSYLQTNCAHCHQFNAGGTANIALGFEVPLKATQTIGIRPIQGTFGIAGARIIAPGDPARSVLFYRMSKLGGGRMPRVGSNQVDERASRMIHDWIATCPIPADLQTPGRSSQKKIANRSKRCASPIISRRSTERRPSGSWPKQPAEHCFCLA